jgi:anti-sigma B factor antagonist
MPQGPHPRALLEIVVNALFRHLRSKLPKFSRRNKALTTISSLALTAVGGYVSFWSHLAEVLMKLSSRLVGQVTIVDVEGKILLGEGDVAIKHAIDELLARGRRLFLLNLARVPYVDSAGLGQIIRCFTAIRKAGGTLKLLSPNPKVVDLLTVTKMVNVFDWYNDEPGALNSFAPTSAS